MKKRVLLCVLDWGLGHATRSLALLHELERKDFEVVVASSGRALALLRLELPGHVFYELPGYDISYNNRLSFELGMLMQSGKILRAVSRERVATSEIVSKEKIHAIISDNRYGCFDATTHSIFLSHHLHIRVSGAWNLLAAGVNALHGRMISKFDEVWVPDHADRILSGELSHTAFRKMTFIGPLSTTGRATREAAKELDILAIMSGPEPERTRFSEMLFNQLSRSGKRFLLVEGIPGGAAVSLPRINFMARNELFLLIENSEVVISRSGYSTIMDLAAMGGKAIFVPTPGQTEQLYLARRMAELGLAPWQAQDKFDLARALEDSVHCSGFDTMKDRKDDLLAKAISNLTE